jgi:hypothetical protein
LFFEGDFENEECAEKCEDEDEVYKFVSDYRGNGFNEQFENIVIDYLRRQDELREQAERMYAHISDLNDRRKSMEARMRKMQDVEYKLKPWLILCFGSLGTDMAFGLYIGICLVYAVLKL